MAWAGAMASSLAVLSACSYDELTFPGRTPAPPSPTLQIGLEVSNLAARAGDRVSVAITNFSTVELGGLQGRLSYDPTRLRFVGQDLDGENATILNTASIDRGLLTVVSVNTKGSRLPSRSAVLTFDVLGEDWDAFLRYHFAAGGEDDGTEIRRWRVLSQIFEGTNLDASSTARFYTDEEWARAIDPSLYLAVGQISRVPGALISGLMYGDCNESGGNVNVFDVLCIQRVAANLDQPISGTDVTVRDAVLASNVSPANLPGLGEGADANPPGVAGGSSTNIDNRTVNVLDALDVQRCAALIAGVCPLGGAGPFTTVVNQTIPGREASQFGRPDSNIVCPINANLTLNRTKRYVVQKTSPIASTVCDIGTDGGSPVTLTIDAGAFIVVDSTTLVVHRNAQIFVNGTVAEPVYMTCTNAVITKGCWGGLYLNGNAPINNGTTTSPAIAGRNGGGALEAVGEGASGLYGGDNPTDNSGVIRFLIIEGAGSRFTATNERNGLTLQAVGSGTVVDYVMSTLGLDDGVEFFGGTVNAKHIYVENTEDDSFDWVAGWIGKLQFGISRGCAVGCDNGIEADNFGSDGGSHDPESLPRSNPTVYNMTLLGQNLTNGAPLGSQHGLLLRANTAGTIRNVLAFGFRVGGFDVDSSGQAQATTHTTFNLICQRLGPGNGQAPAGDDALSVRFGYFGQNFSGAPPGAVAADADPDGGDPRHLAGTGGATWNCGGYGHGGSDLEAQYMALASNNLFINQGPAAGFMVDPWGTVPDFRLLSTAPAGVFACATPPSDGFFDTSATYCGAAPAQNTASVNLPWWSGWTKPRTP
jgi:hypothetical protein